MAEPGERRRVRADELADPFESRHADFGAAIGDVRWTVLWDGGGWLEGPSWSPAGRHLVFSDIPGNRLLRWDETTGAVGVFRHPASFPNGTAYDHEGRLLVCEQGRRRITRTEHDGLVVVIADTYEGRPLNRGRSRRAGTGGEPRLPPRSRRRSRRRGRHLRAADGDRAVTRRSAAPRRRQSDQHRPDLHGGGLLGTIHTPDAVSHVEFGGERGTTLFVCATTALCAIRLTVRGASHRH